MERKTMELNDRWGSEEEEEEEDGPAESGGVTDEQRLHPRRRVVASEIMLGQYHSEDRLPKKVAGEG